jgi:hypothetical protein
MPSKLIHPRQLSLFELLETAMCIVSAVNLRDLHPCVIHESLEVIPVVSPHRKKPVRRITVILIP